MARLAGFALACTVTAACAGARAREAEVRPAPAGAPAAESGAFVIRMGIDTIAVERFARTGNVYVVEHAVRAPRPTLLRSRIELTPAGELLSVSRAEHRIGAPADAPPVTHTEATIRGDSATLVETREDGTVSTRHRAAPPGTVPALPEFYLPWELLARRAVAAGQDRLEARALSPNLAVPPGAVLHFTAARVGPDSVILSPFPDLIFRARVDREGRILGLHATGSTRQIHLTREPTVDVSAFAARWAQAPAMGALSPADSVKATVGGAAVAIHYGRPSKRGRVVFGDSGVAMEPWGKVWRTGANEATRLTTDRDLVIGDAAVPAGTYTLWTLLDRAGWQLIVNRQTLRADGTGRPLWGTGYDARQDLARTRMTMTRPAAPVEQMTILLEPQAAGAVLRVRWDTTEGSVPMRAASPP